MYPQHKILFKFSLINSLYVSHLIFYTLHFWDLYIFETDNFIYFSYSIVIYSVNLQKYVYFLSMGIEFILIFFFGKIILK